MKHEQYPEIKWHRTKHPVCNVCTLYFKGVYGFGVIQQYYNKGTKETSWGPVQGVIADDLYFTTGFMELFNSWARPEDRGEYPIYTLRQVMHALKMKPLKKEPWETVFDHKPI